MTFTSMLEFTAIAPSLLHVFYNYICHGIIFMRQSRCFTHNFWSINLIFRSSVGKSTIKVQPCTMWAKCSVQRIWKRDSIAWNKSFLTALLAWSLHPNTSTRSPLCYCFTSMLYYDIFNRFIMYTNGILPWDFNSITIYSNWVKAASFKRAPIFCILILPLFNTCRTLTEIFCANITSISKVYAYFNIQGTILT